MEGNSYARKAKGIIKKNKYMVIATCGKSHIPWATPLLYAYDEDYNFYFVSAIDSRHASDIAENHRIGIAIYDSEQRMSTMDGIEMEAEAHAVGKEGIEKAIAIYSEKVSELEKTGGLEYEKNNYLEPSEFRFFIVKPTRVYVTSTNRRSEVDLRE